MSELNKRQARRLYDEVITAGKLELLDERIAEDATGFANPTARGRGVFVEHIRALHQGVSGARATVTDLLAEGERVVVYWRLEGTHAGVLWNVPASGKRIDGHSISLISFRAGQIIDYRVMADRLTILQQLGAVSPPVL